jgi:hypothetical protein
MRVSARSITAIGRIVTGDEGLSRYRSGPRLVQLFNEYGANDTYGQGFPSRWQYAETRLNDLNGTPTLGSLLSEVMDPREFMDTKLDVSIAVEYVNKRLRYDGFEVGIDNGLAKVRHLEGSAVECKNPFEGSADEGHLFIEEQLQKCEQKIQDGDYDGAITNGRSLLEAVLTELERKLDSSAQPYDGDLPKLYKRVQRLLNLDPARPEIITPLKQVLSGLAGVVSGLSGISNRMGDRHARTYKPSRRHAVLVVDSAKTLVNFLFDTYGRGADRATSHGGGTA